MILNIFSLDASHQSPKSAASQGELELPPLPASPIFDDADSNSLLRLSPSNDALKTNLDEARAEIERIRIYLNEEQRKSAKYKAQRDAALMKANNRQEALRNVAIHAAGKEPLHRRQLIINALSRTSDPEKLKEYAIGSREIKPRRFCTWCCGSWYSKKTK